MNRLYAIESTPTLTGAKADHRLPLRAAEIEVFARALAASGWRPTGRGRVVIECHGATSGSPPSPKDLQAHRGRSVVVPATISRHPFTRWRTQINQALGNVGDTVTYIPTGRGHTRRIASPRFATSSHGHGGRPGRRAGHSRRATPCSRRRRICNSRNACRRSRCRFTTRLYENETSHLLPLERARGARPRRLERRARVRRHRHDRAAADRAALRKGARSSTCSPRSSTRRPASRATTS